MFFFLLKQDSPHRHSLIWVPFHPETESLTREGENVKASSSFSRILLPAFLMRILLYQVAADWLKNQPISTWDQF